MILTLPVLLVALVFAGLAGAVLIAIVWRLVARLVESGQRSSEGLAEPAIPGSPPPRDRSLQWGRLFLFLLFPPYTIVVVFIVLLEVLRSLVSFVVSLVEVVVDLVGMATSSIGSLLGDGLARARLRRFRFELGSDCRRLVGSLIRPLGVLLSYAGFGGLMARIARKWRVAGGAALAAEPVPEPPPPVSPYEGRYHVLRQIAGGGSTAELFVVQKLDEGEPVGPLLLLKCFDLARGAWLESLLRESEGMRLAKRVGIVADYMFGDDYFYYVMPYYEGQTLAEATLELHGRRKPDAPVAESDLKKVVTWVRQVTEEVRRFHEAGLIHKDIKPENVILTTEGAKLVDIGLVTQLASAMTLTTHGTEYFRDPELVRQAVAGTKVNEIESQRFDVYSLGALLYFVAQGTFPATGPFSRYNRPVPYAVSAVANKAMSDFEKRHDSAADLLADLDALLSARRISRVKATSLPSFLEPVAAGAPASRTLFPSIGRWLFRSSR